MPTTQPARKRLRLALLAASALIVGASGFGTPPWTGVEVPLGAGGSLRIGAVRTAPWGAALAANVVTLNDVTVEFGGASYSIPTLTLTGLNLPQGELTALFDKAATEPLSARLARLSAQEVTIPALTVTQRVGPETRTTTYRDVTLRDIVNGRIAAATSAGASVAVEGRPAGPVSGTLGTMTLTVFDASQAARLYEAKADAQAGAMARIHETFALENLAISDPKGAQVRVARITGRDFSARPTKESWGETMTLLSTHADKLDKAPPVDRARLVSALADLLDAFQIGSMEATGFEVRDPNAKDRVGARIARIAFTGSQASKPADLRMEDFDVNADNGRMRIGLVGFSGFSFRSTLDGLKALSDKPAT